MKPASIMALAAACIWTCASAQETQSVADATAAAKRWLAMIDSGNASASWDQAATRFQAALTRAAWVDAVKAVREPLGAVKSRRLRSAVFTRSLPGAPDGEYVVIQYDTSFDNKAEAVETVTPAHEKDGTWRVAGYYVR
jgi:hypothetical protein